MHPNPVFRSSDRATALATAAERGFGVLTINGPGGILASHVPFVIDSATLSFHIPRSNPIGRALRDGPAEALMIVSGPDAYVSPDWYGAADQVPTWNYVAVHIRGALSLAPQDALRGHLDRLSAVNEERLRPKTPWTMAKNQPETLDKLMRALLPLHMQIRDIDATWKLNQNKDDAARCGAADWDEAAGHGRRPYTLAAWMRAGMPE